MLRPCLGRHIFRNEYKPLSTPVGAGEGRPTAGAPGHRPTQISFGPGPFVQTRTRPRRGRQLIAQDEILGISRCYELYPCRGRRMIAVSLGRRKQCCKYGQLEAAVGAKLVFARPQAIHVPVGVNAAGFARGRRQASRPTGSKRTHAQTRMPGNPENGGLTHTPLRPNSRPCPIRKFRPARSCG